MRKRLIYISVLLLCIIIKGQSQAITQIPDRALNVEQWIISHFGQNVLPPFSFEYGGKSSRQFIRKWKYSASKLKSNDPNEIKYRFCYSEPGNGLLVTCEVTGFTDYNTIEWILHFTNCNTANSKDIANVRVSDITFEYDKKRPFYLHYANGSNAEKADFASQLKTLSPGESFYMRPEGGRSSQTRFPFFNMEFSEKEGVMAAIGWTGTWFADIRCKDSKSITLYSGIEHLKTYLYPKESIRTSSICLLFWKGKNRMTGHNLFRRFILAHHTWKINGKPTVYPISTSFNYGDPTPCNEYTCLTSDYAIAMVKRYEQFKIVPDVFWLDAGWYNHSADIINNKNWANTVGNWSVDSIRFPQGLRPIADEVHRVGAKFMLWFEPERVMKDSEWAIKYPQWMLDARGDIKNSDKDNKHDSFLFNLGNPEACKWLCKYIGDFMQNNGVDYYRQDFNIEPEGFWRANDKSGREGMCEIKYIEGLYTFWEYLLNRFPGMLIDNCASGGRRLDLESITRSAPMWRTDYNYGEPIGYQCHTYGLEMYLPLHGTGTVSTDKFTFRSSLGTSIIYNWKVTEPEFSFDEMRRCQKEFKELRPYFYEDFYPLSDTKDITSDDIWLAYQLNCHSDDSGYIVAFRRKSNKDDKYTVRLSGLYPNKVYLLTNKDTEESFKKTGKELADGFTLHLQQPESSLLIKYQSNLSQPAHQLTVGPTTNVKIRTMGVELDPHFFAQNITRNDGSKAKDWYDIVEKRVKEMSIQSFRVMVQPQWYEPQNDNNDPQKTDWDKLTFDSQEMQSLYKVLDLAQKLNIQVNLTLWGAPLGHFLAGNNEGNWMVAPSDYQEWSENYSALIRYLLNDKHYTCIKEITPINEPDWSFLIKGKKAPTAAYIEMCKVLNERFIKDGIRNKIHFNLSDNSDEGMGTHKYLAACTRELSTIADIFNSHTYIFGYETPNSVIRDWERENFLLAKSAGKQHFVGEFGGNQCIGPTRQKDINLYERGVLMSRIVINLLNGGACGVSYWSLLDQYYDRNASYNDMQQLGLWKYVKNAYSSDTCYKNIKDDYEVRPQYYAYSLLTRFILPNAEVYPIATSDEFFAGSAIKNEDGKWIYVFANSTNEEKNIDISNAYANVNGAYQVFRYVVNELPDKDQQILPNKQSLKVAKTIKYKLPPHSVILFKQI